MPNHIATRIRYLHIRLTVPHNPSNWQRRCSHSDLLRRFATKPLALAISCALLASPRDLPQVFFGGSDPRQWHLRASCSLSQGQFEGGAVLSPKQQAWQGMDNFNFVSNI